MVLWYDERLVTTQIIRFMSNGSGFSLLLLLSSVVLLIFISNDFMLE